MATDFFANGLCFYCDMVIRDLDEYRDFHSRTEALWKELDKSLQDDIDNVIHAHPDIDEQELIDSYAWELHLNQTKYPDIHRTALVISLHAFLEDQLNGLCSLLGRSIDSPIELKDVAGQGVERVALYLTKVALFDLGKVSRWSFVKSMTLLRNKLAHAGGVLSRDTGDKLNRFVADSEWLVGTPGGSIGIMAEFIDYQIDELCKLFEELDDEVQKFMKRVGVDG